MKLKEVLKDIKVLELAADVSMDIAGISYDSRKTKPGDMFVAISGFESDGYDYIPSAVKNGACVILCDRAPKLDIPYVCLLYTSPSPRDRG